jgi:hypothetical protein
MMLKRIGGILYLGRFGIIICCLNVVTYGLIGVGLWMMYKPLGLAIPGLLLWVELYTEAYYARNPNGPTPRQ